MSEPTVEWLHIPNLDAQDASFYDEGLIARVEYDGKELGIYSCGVMKVYYKDETIRNGRELVSLGIDTDEKLFAAEKDMDWHNNKWFEVMSYDEPYYSESLFICHSLFEAVSLAKKYIKENH